MNVLSFPEDSIPKVFLTKSESAPIASDGNVSLPGVPSGTLSFNSLNLQRISEISCDVTEPGVMRNLLFDASGIKTALTCASARSLVGEWLV